MDNVADFLTRIRNANAKQKDRVDIPLSNLKQEIARIFKEEGFIANYKTIYSNDRKKGTLRVFLKYSPLKESVIRGLRRVSRPGLRKYCAHDNIPRPRTGFAVTILSTSQGVLTDSQAKEKKVGGEVLCQIW
ncbi:MAG: 30S ribosomal protein S8 [Elusimicrobiota bacterium]